MTPSPKLHRLRNRLILLGLLAVLAIVGVTQGREIWEFFAFATIPLLVDELRKPFRDDHDLLLSEEPRMVVFTARVPRWWDGPLVDFTIWDVETGREIVATRSELEIQDSLEIGQTVALEDPPPPVVFELGPADRLAPWVRADETHESWCTRMTPPYSRAHRACRPVSTS